MKMAEKTIVSSGSSSKKTRSRTKCSVSTCSSQMSKNTNLFFHKLPLPKQTIHRVNHFGKSEQVDRLNVWLKVLKLKVISSYTRVCSLHFGAYDYFPDAVGTKI